MGSCFLSYHPDSYEQARSACAPAIRGAKHFSGIGDMVSFGSLWRSKRRAFVRQYPLLANVTSAGASVHQQQYVSGGQQCFD